MGMYNITRTTKNLEEKGERESPKGVLVVDKKNLCVREKGEHRQYF